MYVSQKIKLDLTTEQKHIFENYFGQSRFIYNRSVDVCKELFNKYCKLRKEGKNIKEVISLFPTKFSLLKAIRAKYKKEKWDKNWDIKINKNIFEITVEHCSRAFEAKFGKNRKSYKSDYKYFLKYKSRKEGKYSFSFKTKGDNGKIFLLSENRLVLPSFSGHYSHSGSGEWISKYGTLKLKEPIREIFLKRLIGIKKATIKRYGSNYFIYLQLEVLENPYKSLPKNSITKAIGIDLGVKDLIVGVDDECNELCSNIPDLSKYERKIRRLQRLLDIKRTTFFKEHPKEEKYIESNMYKKTLIHLQNTRLKRNNILETYYHTLTKEILKDYDIICMEDLSSNFMHKCHNLASAKMRKGNRLYELRRMLEYKSLLYERELVKIDRFFPSTQTCSLCGNRKVKENKLKLKNRVYKCSNPSCLYHTHPIDRDLNAAKNILKEGLRLAGYEIVS